MTENNSGQPPLSNDQLAAVLLIAGLAVLAFYRRHTLLRQLNDWLHGNGDRTALAGLAWPPRTRSIMARRSGSSFSRSASAGAARPLACTRVRPVLPVVLGRSSVATRVRCSAAVIRL